MKEKSKSQKLIPKKKASLEFLHQILGYKYTKSILDGYTANAWQDIDIRVDPDPFCTSCPIFTINKVLIKDTFESKYTFQVGFHGHHNSHIFQKFNKRH